MLFDRVQNPGVYTLSLLSARSSELYRLEGFRRGDIVQWSDPSILMGISRIPLKTCSLSESWKPSLRSTAAVNGNAFAVIVSAVLQKIFELCPFCDKSLLQKTVQDGFQNFGWQWFQLMFLGLSTCGQHPFSCFFLATSHAAHFFMRADNSVRKLVAGIGAKLDLGGQGRKSHNRQQDGELGENLGASFLGKYRFKPVFPKKFSVSPSEILDRRWWIYFLRRAGLWLIRLLKGRVLRLAHTVHKFMKRPSELFIPGRRSFRQSRTSTGF